MDVSNSLISEDSEKLIVSTLGRERVKVGEELSYHTYSKIGGPARLFYVVTNQKEFVNTLDVVNDLRLNFFVLGAGTKILIPDKGLDAFVIKNKTSAIKIGSFKGKVGRDGLGIEEASLEVDSGVVLSKLSEYLKGQRFKEIDYYSSPNSTIGGSLFIDPILKECVQSIKVWESGEVITIQPDELVINKHIVLSLTINVRAI